MKLQKFNTTLSVLLCFSLGLLSLSCGRAKAAIFSEKAYDYHNKGEYAKAIDMYKKLIALDPKNPINYWDLAIAYVDSKDFDSAREQAAKVRAIDPHLADELDLMIRKSGRGGGVMYSGRHLRLSNEDEE